MFGPKPCPGCDAKDAELRFLREQLDKLTTKLAEVTEPGTAARLAAAERMRNVTPFERKKPHPLDEKVEAQKRDAIPRPLPGL